MELSLFWHWSPHLLIAVSNIKRKSRDIKTRWERWHRKTGSSWLNQPPREARRAWRRISAACQSEEWVWHSGPDCPSLFLLPLFVGGVGGGAEIHWQRHQELHSGDRLSINSSTPPPHPPTERRWESSSSITLDSCIMHIRRLQIRWERRDKAGRGWAQLGFLQPQKSNAVKQHPGIIRAPFCLCVCLVFECNIRSLTGGDRTPAQKTAVQLINLC